MKQVIVFPRGQLTEQDRKVIAKAGAVAVEADDPSKVVTVIPMVNTATPLNADDFTMSLFGAVAASGRHVAERFTKELHARTTKRHRPPVADE